MTAATHSAQLGGAAPASPLAGAVGFLAKLVGDLRSVTNLISLESLLRGQIRYSAAATLRA